MCIIDNASNAANADDLKIIDSVGEPMVILRPGGAVEVQGPSAMNNEGKSGNSDPVFSSIAEYRAWQDAEEADELIRKMHGSWTDAHERLSLNQAVRVARAHAHLFEEKPA